MSQVHDRTLAKPCKLCGAPAGMPCSEYAYLKHVNAAFDKVLGEGVGASER
jgi:hypothetical protein